MEPQNISSGATGGNSLPNFLGNILHVCVGIYKDKSIYRVGIVYKEGSKTEGCVYEKGLSLSEVFIQRVESVSI